MAKKKQTPKDIQPQAGESVTGTKLTQIRAETGLRGKALLNEWKKRRTANK